MASPSPAQPRGERPARGLVDHTMLLVLILTAAGLAALLFDQNRRQDDDALLALLDDQRRLHERLSERLTIDNRTGLQERLETLLAEQHKLRGDVGALNAALTGVMAERDRLRERLQRLATPRAEAPAQAQPGPDAPRFGVDGRGDKNPTDKPHADDIAVPDGASAPPRAGSAVERKPTQAPPEPLTLAKNVPVLRDIPGKGLRLQEIHFSPASSTLSPGAVLKARQAAELFKRQDKSRIRLVGFSDTVGNSEGNRRMSQRRAAAVAKLLVSAGVARDRIEIVAKGEQNTPLLTGDGVDEPLNRCVGIFAID